MIDARGYTGEAMRRGPDPAPLRGWNWPWFVSRRSATRSAARATLSRNGKHAIERHAGEFGLARRHLDLVDHLAGNQVFQRPRQMLRVDALHGGTHAYSRRHELDDLALGLVLLGDAIDEV